MPYVLGIDGCRGGWCVTQVEPRKKLSAPFVVAKLEEIRSLVLGAKLTLIDMPIGLPSAPHSERGCDALARKLLGEASSSLFSPPIREVLDCRCYKTANRRSRSLVQKGISLQSWNLMSKIREVDSFLQKYGSNRRIHESHPEIVFRALAPKAVFPSKRSAEGSDRRLQVLSALRRGAHSAYLQCLDAYPRSAVARDDVLDSMVLGLGGALVLNRRFTLERLGKGARDRCGLRQEIVYPKRAPEALS